MKTSRKQLDCERHQHRYLAATLAVLFEQLTVIGLRAKRPAALREASKRCERLAAGGCAAARSPPTRSR